MTQLYGMVDELIIAVKASDIYKNYVREKERVAKHPQLKEEIDEYRRKNYEMQSMTHDEEMFDRIDQFQKQYEEFRENPLVSDFLEAELAFCRLLQEVTGRIVQAMDFE